MAWFGLKKKGYEHMDTLERIKFHVLETERRIKKIQNEHRRLANSRVRDPRWNRQFGYEGHWQKEYISDAEASGFRYRIVQEEKDFVAKVLPLIEELKNIK